MAAPGEGEEWHKDHRALHRVVVSRQDRSWNTPSKAGAGARIRPTTARFHAINHPMQLVWAFDDTPPPSLAQVGGKGFSLIRMTGAGLAVPPGFVLSVEFFEPWFDVLRRTEAWRRFVPPA